MNNKVIAGLEKQLADLQTEYHRLITENMQDGVVVVQDETVERQLQELKQNIVRIKSAVTSLKYSVLTDEEKRKSRQDQISLTEKFSDEGTNAQRLVYMNYYLQLVEKTRELAFTRSEKQPEYRGLLEYLNGQDFRYSLSEPFDNFCTEDLELKELYLQMKTLHF